MNDDFLKKHQKQPDPAFVNNLHSRLTTQARRDQRLRKISRVVISGLAACLLVFVGLAIFSPAARAEIREFLLTFNGVDVYRDPDTGKLEAEGNIDAVVIQEDHMVGIESDDGTELEIVAEVEVQASEMPVDELLASYPDFTLPSNLPAGYSLNPNGIFMSDDHGFTFVWTHPNGEFIHLTRTRMMQPELPENEDGKVVEVFVSMEKRYQILEHSDDLYAVYTWTEEDDPYRFMLTASDETITEAELVSIAK